ncbi:MAG: hypothetical protein M1830_007364 [Pleopsidium flavum]|nr:MAG: hypothetical protein M1830_007364 [Pleopsidium flavum]
MTGQYIKSKIESWCNTYAEVSRHKPPGLRSDRVVSMDWKRATCLPVGWKRPGPDSSSTIWFALLIADQITDARDLVNLARTSRAHYETLIKKVYRTIHFYFSDDAVKSRRHHLDLCPGDIPFQPLSLSSTEVMARCWLDDRLVGRSKYITCQEKKRSKYAAVFRFSGSYPSTAWGQLWDEDVQPPDPWKLQFGRLSDLINLQEYKADVDWRLADMNQVVQLPCFLKSLTVPVRYPGDCAILGRELKRFKNLESLTILSLPILDRFVDAFPQLAEGLAARASSLRSLAIELTAHSRPYSWDTDDFVVPEPTEMDKYFRALFPTPVKHGKNICRVPLVCWDRDEPQTVFQLTYLGLQHFGIPSNAFQEIFSKDHIKDLSLPNCKADPEVWNDLRGSVNLRSLTHIDYDLLTPQLVNFIASQRSLETLIFSKPLPDRQLLGVASLGPGTSPWYQTEIINRGEPQHQNLAHLGKTALRNLSNLKSLSIPADMYDISCRDIQNLCYAFPRLERLELALNYDNLALLQSFRDCFLRLHPHLRKITFLSCRGKDPLHLLRYREQLSQPRPFCQGIRYLRYFLLNGERQTYYEGRADPQTGIYPQHMKLEGQEGDEIFDEETTPMIYPPPRPMWEIEEEQNNKKEIERN